MTDNFIVPVYIDTNALLDLLASIEGGFSLVEKVTSRTTAASEKDRGVNSEAGTEFGIPNVLSLLKIKLDGSISVKKSDERSEERETERFHTYGSLLHRLRSYLEDENLVIRIGSEDTHWEEIQPSNFVEVKGIVRPNSLSDTFQRIERLIGIVQLVSGLDVESSGGSRAGKSGRNKDDNQMSQIRKFINGVLSDIEKENIRTFVIDLASPESGSAVLLIYTDYLRDPTMTEIEHKEYRILGKVVRKIDEGSDETIDLLRGTGMGGIGKETLEKLVSSFDQMEGMNLPSVKTEVSGPALEIVPIAIFV